MSSIKDFKRTVRLRNWLDLFTVPFKVKRIKVILEQDSYYPEYPRKSYSLDVGGGLKKEWERLTGRKL